MALSSNRLQGVRLMLLRCHVNLQQLHFVLQTGLWPLLLKLPPYLASDALQESLSWPAVVPATLLYCWPMVWSSTTGTLQQQLLSCTSHNVVLYRLILIQAHDATLPYNNRYTMIKINVDGTVALPQGVQGSISLDSIIFPTNWFDIILSEAVTMTYSSTMLSSTTVTPTPHF